MNCKVCGEPNTTEVCSWACMQKRAKFCLFALCQISSGIPYKIVNSIEYLSHLEEVSMDEYEKIEEYYNEYC